MIVNKRKITQRSRAREECDQLRVITLPVLVVTIQMRVFECLCELTSSVFHRDDV